MKLKQYESAFRSVVIFLLLLLLGIFQVPSATATGQTDALDVAEIDAFVREQVRRHGIPGLALAVVDGDQIVHRGGYGKADQSGRPITPQTPFVLASLSKPVTALAIMQLVEAGKLELDAPVQRYLPTFQLANPQASQQITIRHLLNHTSGIPEQGCQNSRFGATTAEQFVAKLRSIHLSTSPGTRYSYCSGNYNVLGRIIEVVSGQSYGSYIEQQIFVPLQMRHSFVSEEAARREGVAQGYRWLFGVPLPMDYAYDVPQMPSGYLIASAEDMARFLAVQLNDGRFGTTAVLSPKGIAAMHAPGVATGAGESRYGLGWQTGSLDDVPAVYHRGGHPNVNTLMFFNPETQRGAVILINSQNVLASVGAFKQIEDGVARLLAGNEPGRGPALSLPTLYGIVDVVLACGLGLALWSVLRMRHWQRRMQKHQHGRWRVIRAIVRIGCEFGLPLVFLGGARWLLNGLGALSWSEGLLLFPDFAVWLWVISGVLIVTGAIRLTLLLLIMRPGLGTPAGVGQRFGTKPS